LAQCLFPYVGVLVYLLEAEHVERQTCGLRLRVVTADAVGIDGLPGGRRSSLSTLRENGRCDRDRERDTSPERQFHERDDTPVAAWGQVWGRLGSGPGQPRPGRGQPSGNT